MRKTLCWGEKPVTKDQAPWFWPHAMSRVGAMEGSDPWPPGGGAKRRMAAFGYQVPSGMTEMLCWRWWWLHSSGNTLNTNGSQRLRHMNGDYICTKPSVKIKQRCWSYCGHSTAASVPSPSERLSHASFLRNRHSGYHYFLQLAGKAALLQRHWVTYSPKWLGW